MRAQVLVHERRRLGVSPEIQERPGNLITPQRGVGPRSRLVVLRRTLARRGDIQLRNHVDIPRFPVKLGLRKVA